MVHAPLEVVLRVVVGPRAAAAALRIRPPAPIDPGQVPERGAERQENKDGPPGAEAAAHRGRSGRGRATATGGVAIRSESHGSTDHHLVVLAAASQGAGPAVKGRAIGEARTEAIPGGQGVVTGVALRPPTGPVVRAGRVVLVPRILAAQGQSVRRAVIGARLRAPTRRGLTRRDLNSGNGRVRPSGRVDTLARQTSGRRVVGAAMHRAVTVLIANLGGVGRARVMGAALARRPNANEWTADQMTGHRGPVAQTSLAAADFRPRGVGSHAKRVEGLVRRIWIARLGAKTALAGSKPRRSSTTKAGESLVALWAKIRRRGLRRKASRRNAQKGPQLSTVRIMIGPVLDFPSGEAALPRDPVIATAVVTKIDPAERAGDPMTGPIDRAIGQALAAPRGAVPGAAVSTAPGPPAWVAQAIGADR